jgi:hypothetical protein
LHLFPVDFNPIRDSLALVGLDQGLHVLGLGRFLLERDDIVFSDEKRRNIDFLIAYTYVAVSNELPSLSPRMRKPGDKNDIIQSPLQHRKKMFTGDSPFSNRSAEKEPELLFRHAVISFQLLLFPELKSVSQDSSPRPSMLSGRIKPSFNRAFLS